MDPDQDLALCSTHDGDDEGVAAPPVVLVKRPFEAEIAGLPSAYASPAGELLLAFGPDGRPVAPGAQSAGLGRCLLDAALAFARAAGSSTATA